MASLRIQVPQGFPTTSGALQTALTTAGPTGTLPIPSQKNGICVNDSIASTLFYSNELRDFFWATYIFPYPPGATIDVNCHLTTNGIPQTDAELNAILQCWLQLSSARVVGILSRQYVREEPPAGAPAIAAPQRMPSLPFDVPQGARNPGAVGNECGRLAVLYNGAVRRQRDTLALTPEHEAALFQGLIQRANGAGFPMTMELLYPGQAPAGTPVAYYVRLVHSDGSNWHAVSVLLIGDRWYWCDNEYGLALPLPVGFDPRFYAFQQQDERGVYRVNIAPIHIAQGGPGGTVINVPNPAGVGSVTLTERPDVQRRVICAPPGSGVASANRVLAERMSAALQRPPAVAIPSIPSTSSSLSLSPLPSIGSSPMAYGRNSYDPQANVKDAFNTWNQGGRGRRLKRTSRQSSLPKPKAPSSGHLRGYTRRRRALRSGTGGYRATKTGRKV